MFKQIIIVVLLVFPAFFSCKKYVEDDKRYLFKSPKSRLLGTWQLTAYFMNGGDSLSYILKRPDHINVTEPLKITKKTSNKEGKELRMKWNVAEGDIEFRDHKNKLTSHETDRGWPTSPFNGAFWAIRKLTVANMKLELTKQGVTHVMEFAKK